MSIYEITRQVCVLNGIATMDDGTSVDLKKIQALLNEGFASTGNHQLMQASDELAKLTGMEQTSRGFVRADAPDPDALQPNWSNDHCAAAQAEGWAIFDTYGSEGGPWQLQRFDDAAEAPGSKQLESDDAAWLIAFTGQLPHHKAACDFIRVHNPMEYEWALRNLHPLRHMNASSTHAVNDSDSHGQPPLRHDLRKPAGYTIGGFTVGHNAKMNGNSAVAMIVDLKTIGDVLAVLLEFSEPQPLDVPEGATTRFIEVRSQLISATWRQA